MKGIKTVEISKYPDCDICKLEFPSSKPNAARYDGPINGVWGYMCEAHKIVIKGLTTRLEVKKS